MTEAQWNSAVIVWPETSIPAYLNEVNEWFLLPLSKAAQQHNTDLMLAFRHMEIRRMKNTMQL